MKITDKARNKVFTFVHIVEEFKDNGADCLEETVKKKTVNAVLAAAGRAELGMTAEGNKFKFTVMGTAVHGAAKG